MTSHTVGAVATGDPAEFGARGLVVDHLAGRVRERPGPVRRPAVPGCLEPAGRLDEVAHDLGAVQRCGLGRRQIQGHGVR